MAVQSKGDIAEFIVTFFALGGIQAGIAWLVKGLSPLQIMGLCLTILWTLMNIFRMMGFDFRVWNKKDKREK